VTCVAVVDTTFARVDMAPHAINALLSEMPGARVRRLTVPGIKNTPWAVKKLLDEGCDAALVLGWVGPTLVDKISYAVASLGLVLIQLETGKLVIDAVVHEDEGDPGELRSIAIDRAVKHARNLAMLLLGRDLSRWAGMGLRQGRPDVGPL